MINNLAVVLESFSEIELAKLKLAVFADLIFFILCIIGILMGTMGTFIGIIYIGMVLAVVGGIGFVAFSVGILAQIFG